jgi:hypothetical protein
LHIPQNRGSTQIMTQKPRAPETCKMARPMPIAKRPSKKNQRISKERKKDLKFNPVYMVCAGTCGHVVQLREKRKPQDAQDGKRKPDRKGGEFEWPPQAEHKRKEKKTGLWQISFSEYQPPIRRRILRRLPVSTSRRNLAQFFSRASHSLI